MRHAVKYDAKTFRIKHANVTAKYRDMPAGTHAAGSNYEYIYLLINGKVIVECKAVSIYNSIFEAQILTYLRLTSLKLGFVIHFGERMIKNSIHRVVNRL